jgi:hypothetical protein
LDKKEFMKKGTKIEVSKFSEAYLEKVDLTKRNSEFDTKVDYEAGFLDGYMESFNRRMKLIDEITSLQKFKDYVHNRLDEMGIEKDPESPHKKMGCRIGGRLDIIESKINPIELFEIGDIIEWSFPEDAKLPHFLKGKTFQEEIVFIDLECKAYCVYCEYGYDKIPFNDAKFISHGKTTVTTNESTEVKDIENTQGKLTYYDDGEVISISSKEWKEFIEFWYFGYEDLKIEQEKNLKIFLNAKKTIENCNLLTSELLEQKEELRKFVDTFQKTDFTSPQRQYFTLEKMILRASELLNQTN